MVNRLQSLLSISTCAATSRRGKIQTMLCCCFPGPDTTIVGTQDGSLYLFKVWCLDRSEQTVLKKLF